MQDKHVVIVRADEDRDIFINKVKYPKTVYQVEGKGQPEKDDIVFDGKRGFPATMATWILENWNNLPDFVIFCQANPNDHVADMISALDVTLTANFGSFSFARATHNQYTTNWVRCNPCISFLKEFGIDFHNANNFSKFIFFFYPGDHFYISKKKILEKSKSFFEKLIYFDNEDNYYNFLKNDLKPPYFNSDLFHYHPEWRNLSTQDRYEKFISSLYGRDYGNFGLTFEIINSFLFADKSLLSLLEKSQAALYNKLYFQTNSNNYDPNYSFSIFPYDYCPNQTTINTRLLENNWFDYSCTYYLKWREKIIEKFFYELNRQNTNPELILKYYQKMGYKHISL